MTVSAQHTYLSSRIPRVGVVIPCYRVRKHIVGVVDGVLSLQEPVVAAVYIVDDCCPERTGDLVASNVRDTRVTIIRHELNSGVGGAVKTGYEKAIADRMDIIVKIDGDGQMDPALLPRFIRPLLKEQADYVKGNRFYDLTRVHRMPAVRLFGNAVLSFLSKLSTGYWAVFDPTNGYTAIRTEVAGLLPFHKISDRYFFETDMLFRLNLMRAVVVDIPMDAVYEDEVSNLKISHVLCEFLYKHARNFVKRIFYRYYLHDCNIGSIQLLVGTGMLAWGILFGLWHWAKTFSTASPTPIGTVMLAALPVLVGIQFLLAFVGYDIQGAPTRPLSDDLNVQQNSSEHPEARNHC